MSCPPRTGQASARLDVVAARPAPERGDRLGRRPAQRPGELLHGVQRAQLVDHGPLHGTRGRRRDVRGVAVHEAVRIMGEAAAGEILVSETTRALVQARDFAFDDRGMHMLKGLEGERRLYAFLSNGA